MHASIGGIGVIYPDTSFVDNKDMDKINPILQKFPNTVDGPALVYSGEPRNAGAFSRRRGAVTGD